MRISLKMPAKRSARCLWGHQAEAGLNEKGSITRARSARTSLANDAFDLADRVGLAVDRQQRRRQGEVYRADHALDLGGDSHGFACVVRYCGGQLVVAVRPLRAIGTLAVPEEVLIVAGLDIIAAAEDDLSGTVGDRDVHDGLCRDIELPVRLGSLGHGGGVAVDDCGPADEAQRLRRL